MKYKVINTAVCDARDVREESLSGFEKITVNTAVLLTNPRARELLNRYPVVLNAASVVDIPEGKDIRVQTANGKYELGPDADGMGVCLVVNGKMTMTDGSLDSAKSFTKILVNGKVLMPASYRGKLQNMEINGKAIYYPDGAQILKNVAVIDDLFIMRAAGVSYYSPGSLFFMDTAMDTTKLLEKDMRFAARKVIIAESLLPVLITRIDEEAEIVRVPDGTRLIDGDTELKPAVIRKYGPKLCVCGDVKIADAEALSALEYLYAEGTVSVNKDLEEAFEKIGSVYDELKIIDPSAGYLTDRPFVRIGASMLKKYPGGIRVRDCAKVTLSEDLTPEMILEKILISDCAVVNCTKEQEEAVSMIASDVAAIRTSGEEEDGAEDGSFFGMLRGLRDTQMINAVEYRM